jgi:hypothetical protein
MGGNHDRQRFHEAGPNPQQRRPFTNRLPHPREISPREVAKSAVNDSQTVRGCGCAKVVLVDNGNGEASQTRIPSSTGTVNACADDEKVKRRISELRKVASHAPVRVMPGVPAQQVSGPGYKAMRRCLDPLAYAIRAPMGRAQMNDDFSH